MNELRYFAHYVSLYSDTNCYHCGVISDDNDCRNDDKKKGACEYTLPLFCSHMYGFLEFC